MQLGQVAAFGVLAAGGAWLRQRQRGVLHGRVAWVTGGSRGLGMLVARELLRKGCAVAISARGASSLEGARRELAALGGRCIAVPCDVGDRDQVGAALHRIERELGGVDVLVNVAGIIQVGPLETMEDADYERAMRTHFWGPHHTAQAVLPRMRARRWGRIVNVSSVGGKVAVPHLAPYTASKFALTGYSQALAAELRRHGIRVTTVIPGLMRTGSPERALFKGQHKKEYAWFVAGASTPLSSMSATRAARQIVAACERGQPERVLSIQAKALVWTAALFPNSFSRLLSWVALLLPAPGGVGRERVEGRASHSALAPTWLRVLSDRAALRNRELV